MSLTKYLSNLRTKHDQLEDDIKQEMTRPLPNFNLITNLKKQKLRTKDLINRLTFKIKKQEYQTSG